MSKKKSAKAILEAAIKSHHCYSMVHKGPSMFEIWKSGGTEYVCFLYRDPDTKMWVATHNMVPMDNQKNQFTWFKEPIPCIDSYYKQKRDRSGMVAFS
jgi:hypothetical protein